MITLPRLPVDGKKVIEHRITFGTKERDLLEQFVGVQRTRSFLGEDGLALIDDPKKLILMIETLATLAELFGFKTPIPTPVDAYEWLEGVKKKAGEEWWDVDLRRDFERFFG